MLDWLIVGGGGHISGPLAALEIGPLARNILGARLSAERLLGAA